MDPVLAHTRRWIDSLVIGLDLCPFAGRVFRGDLIRYVVCPADNGAALFDALGAELKTLAATPIAEVETTLLIHPQALGDFLEFNDFLGDADRLLDQLGLAGTIQIASFHPEYRFHDATADALENYTNRSPYPMLHLLREESISAVADDAEALAEIPRRNIETMRRLGREALAKRLAEIRAGQNPTR